MLQQWEGGDGGRDQGLRRRHLTSMGRRSLNARARQMARHPAFIVGLEFVLWAILAIAFAVAVLMHIGDTRLFTFVLHQFDALLWRVHIPDIVLA